MTNDVRTIRSLLRFFLFMAIYKSKHASNYTVLPNEVFKSKLSIEAIGLLAYFLSLPPDWVIYKTTLHNQLNIGRDKLNKVFDELRNAGYVISVEKRDAGKISYEHIVYDTPYNGEPLTDKPSTEKPSTVKLPLLSTNIPSTNKLITNKQINITFDTFWNLYDKKIDKDKCESKWNKLSNKEREDIINHIPKYKLATPDKQYRKNPETYFNNKTWRDEIINSNSQPKQIIQQPTQINYKDLAI